MRCGKLDEIALLSRGARRSSRKIGHTLAPSHVHAPHPSPQRREENLGAARVNAVNVVAVPIEEGGVEEFGKGTAATRARGRWLLYQEAQLPSPALSIRASHFSYSFHGLTQRLWHSCGAKESREGSRQVRGRSADAPAHRS